MSEAMVGYRDRMGLWIPGSVEWPRILSRKDALRVRRAGRVIFRAQPIELGSEQTWFALDSIWSPDSTLLAYRRVYDLFIVDVANRTMNKLPLSDDSFIVTSFRWLDSSNLLVVLKDAVRGYGRGYPTYIDNAISVRIVAINIKTSDYDILLEHPLNRPVFLFHSPLFRIEEISPYSERVAFSDGHHLKIFDANSMGFVADVALPGSIDGIWWHDEDRLLVGSGLLTRDYRFFTITVSDEITEEVTDQLVPVWMMWLSKLSVCPYGAWADPRWYERGESLFE